MKNTRIPRASYVEKLMSRRMNGFVKVITGIRRCGKSYLLRKLFCERLLDEGVPPDHIVSVDLDDKAFVESLRRQYQEKKALSPRQIAALKRMAASYKLV